VFFRAGRGTSRSSGQARCLDRLLLMPGPNVAIYAITHRADGLYRHALTVREKLGGAARAIGKTELTWPT